MRLRDLKFLAVPQQSPLFLQVNLKKGTKSAHWRGCSYMRQVSKNENRSVDLGTLAPSRKKNYLHLKIGLYAIFLRKEFFFALEHRFFNFLNNFCSLSRKSKILIWISSDELCTVSLLWGMHEYVLNSGIQKIIYLFIQLWTIS